MAHPYFASPTDAHSSDIRLSWLQQSEGIIQKLTRKTWFKTIKQDLAIIFRLLFEALKCFIMFDYGEVWFNLLVAWLMFWGEVVREDEE